MKPDPPTPRFIFNTSISNSARKHQRQYTKWKMAWRPVTEFKAAQESLPKSGQPPKEEARQEAFENKSAASWGWGEGFKYRGQELV